MKQKYFIDTQKGATAFFVLAMMAVYRQWDNPTAWVYLALHGTYGFLWILKSRVFPDRKWEQATGWGYGFVIWGSLSLYWVAPWLLNWRGIQTPGWYLALCISLYSFGVFFHFSADMQKYIALQLHPEHLITGGLFSRCRNINYFGELLIYAGFGLLAMHWLPLAILLLWILAFWLPNMRKKDRSLARYPEFGQYQRKSKLFIPYLF